MRHYSVLTSISLLIISLFLALVMNFELWITQNSKFIIQNSFMMIRFPVQDSHRSIELFDEDQADHLMRKGHLAEGDFL